jgi:hypothetical protein
MQTWGQAGICNTTNTGATRSDTRANWRQKRVSWRSNSWRWRRISLTYRTTMITKNWRMRIWVLKLFTFLKSCKTFGSLYFPDLHCGIFWVWCSILCITRKAHAPHIMFVALKSCKTFGSLYFPDLHCLIIWTWCNTLYIAKFSSTPGEPR